MPIWERNLYPRSWMFIRSLGLRLGQKQQIIQAQVQHDWTDDYTPEVIMWGVAKIFTSGHSKGGFDRTPRTPSGYGYAFDISLDPIPVWVWCMKPCTHSPCPTPDSAPYHLLAAGCYVLCLLFKCGDGKVYLFFWDTIVSAASSAFREGRSI